MGSISHHAPGPALPMSAMRLPGSWSWRNWRTRGQALPCRSLRYRAVLSYTSCTCCFSNWAASWSILGKQGHPEKGRSEAAEGGGTCPKPGNLPLPKAVLLFTRSCKEKSLHHSCQKTQKCIGFTGKSSENHGLGMSWPLSFPVQDQFQILEAHTKDSLG